jgi:aryl-alcohol dehydrogenase-like predicted oxidoreductase
LKFDFLNKSAEEAAATALKFTLSIPGVDTLIVGTTKPNRWQENADYIAEGNLSDEEYAAIRQRWNEVADESWIGKT